MFLLKFLLVFSRFLARTITDQSSLQHVLPLTVTRTELGGQLVCNVSSAALDTPILRRVKLDVKGKLKLYN
ncbi:unnamed protein product [Euphydryas editha]|uniref:Secreted protein n=1 Tax=Euphydryas editha TaxID=104508 RepID=A0AAU9UGA4_EUPED|nr:unnamed protein product [Euphydryas editha]